MTNPQQPDHAQGASTLVEALNELADGGFAVDMITRPEGRITCGQCREELPASDFTVVETRRLEGASDPSDMALVAGLQCPSCQARGSVVARYGPEMDVQDQALLDALDVEDDDWTPAAP